MNVTIGIWMVMAIPGVGHNLRLSNALEWRTPSTRPIDCIAENNALANNQAKKNPGALAGASEVKHCEKAFQLSQNPILICTPCASLAVQNA